MANSRPLCVMILTAGLVLASCSASPQSTHPAAPIASDPVADEQSDLEKVRSADASILFVGNSHTSGHDLPKMIGQMMRFRRPERTVYSHFVSVGFLEDAAHDPTCRREIETRPWKFVVLQGQKESKTGQFQYSLSEGIELAKLAQSRGANVVFFSEWGLRDVPDHGPRIEKVYDEMAKASGGSVAPVGRAWDLARASQPDMPLYSFDGNHQSAIGAFLTAAVLAGKLSGESPATLASFPFEGVNAVDHNLLLEAAVKALAQKTEAANPKP